MFATGILKQMAWAAGGSCAGGLVAGPPGALVGGIAGKNVKWGSCVKGFYFYQAFYTVRIVHNHEYVKRHVEISSLRVICIWVMIYHRKQLHEHVAVGCNSYY